MKWVSIQLLGVLLAAWPAGGMEVSLPLEGWYRAGKYMPVEVRGERSIAVYGVGMVGAEILFLKGYAAGVLPVLPVDDSVTELRHSGMMPGEASMQLKALSAGQRLVGYLGGVEEGVAREKARGRFPEMEIVLVDVKVEAVRGREVAWGALDLLVVDSAERVDVGAPELAGIGVSVVGEELKRERSVVPGPVGAGVDGRVFGPVLGWRAEWPGELRRRAGVLGVIAAIVLMGVLLLRGWGRVIGGVVVGVMLAVGIAVWGGMREAVVMRVGDVLIQRGEGRMRLDRWMYVTAMRETAYVQPFDGVTFPYFASRRAMEGAGVVIVCDGEGRPMNLKLTLRPGEMVGFLSRSEVLVEGSLPAASGMERVPMERLGRDIYLGAGWEMKRVGGVEGGSLGAVMVERR